MKDFFISYTGVDEEWAEWVAWQLEEAGYTVTIQKWDFRPGNNFVLEMDKASKQTNKTMSVLSQAYIDGIYTQPEWAQALADDATGEKRKLIPIKIEDLDIEGLLGPVVHIDLVGADPKTAKTRLLDGVKEGRAKPKLPPKFPGSVLKHSDSEPNFPGHKEDGEDFYIPYIPKLAKITDLDRANFIEQGFEQIRQYFDKALSKLQTSNDGVVTKFKNIDSETFLVEIYLNGDMKEKCKIWLGSPYGDTKQICYSTGTNAGSSNSYNEIISTKDVEGSIYLAAMNMGYSNYDLDLKKLTAKEASKFLWKRFTENIGR